jgi:hypothetical protein
MVENAHHEIHNGRSFGYSEVVELAGDATRDIQITTGAGARYAHFSFEFYAEAETEWWMWENVGIVLAGTTVTPLNYRRSSTNTSVLTIKYIDNASLALANADTTTATATLLSHGFMAGGKKAGGSAATRREWILKPSEDYLIRFDATAAGYVSYALDWYEHTDKS